MNEQGVRDEVERLSAELREDGKEGSLSEQRRRAKSQLQALSSDLAALARRVSAHGTDARPSHGLAGISPMVGVAIAGIVLTVAWVIYRAM